MARLINVPGLASVLLVSRPAEIEDLIDHPALDRSFARAGPLLNRMLAASLDRRMRHRGQPLDAFRSRNDPIRAARQAALLARLDAITEKAQWPAAPIMEMARYVVEGRDRRGAEAALAFAVAWPFLGLAPADDDAYKPVGRHLWRLHLRLARAASPLSPRGLLLRFTGADRRARLAILERTGGDAYGLHAVEITLANARVVLERMRRVLARRRGDRPLSAREVAWAAVRTAPEVVLRQSGATASTLPHVASRVPPSTLVLLRMRRELPEDAASGYEFASGHWSACPARRYVMGLFGAVASTAVDLSRGGLRR